MPTATATPTDVDEQASWSRHCKAGNFDLCDELGFKCKNPRHKSEGETAVQRRERLLAEARAARTGEPSAETTAALPAQSSPPTPKPRTEGSAALRGRVLATLLREDGQVEHVAGRATALLAQLCDYDGAVAGFTQLLGAMEQDSLVDRTKRGTKTFAIAITEIGERLAHDLGVADAAPLPRPRPDTSATRHLELVDDAAPVVATPQPIRSREGGRAGASPTTAPKHERDPKIEVVFENPPERRNGRRGLDEILEQEGVLDALRKRPGDWARLISYGGGSGASSAVNRLAKCEHLGDFEFLSKRQPRSSSSDVAGSVLYGRFNPNGER